MRKNFFALLMTALLLFSVTAGCGKQQPRQTEAPQPSTQAQTEAPAQPAYGVEQITVGTTGVIETATREEYNYDMLASGVSELPLVYQDVNGSYHPLLANYETSDATTWTYTVVDGMTWDDGVPVTAEDILFTLQHEDAGGSAIFEDKTGEDGKTTAAKYTGYELSEDKMSISLTLAAANVRELSNMTSFRVMPKHIYEGKETVTEAEARIGCGPYKFESFNKEAGTVTFVVNPVYPGTPNVERIVYQIFGNEDTMYLALQNGDIDLVWNYSMSVPANYAEALGDTVALENVPAVNVPAVLAFNNASGLFTDENLRLAVSCALNYDQFKEYFGSEYSVTPNRGFVPGTTVGYIDTEPLVYDAAKAEEFMAAAGYTSKNDDGFFVNGEGRTAAFTLTYNAGKETHAGYAELIKTQLEAFGIQVVLDGVDKDSYNAKTSNKFSGNHITMEAAIYGYTAAGMGMGSGLGTIYADGAHAVQGGCQVFDDEFTAALEKMENAKTMEAYYAGAADMQTYYADHVPMLALYWDSMTYAHSAGLENVTVDCVFGLNNINNWFTVTEK